MNLQADWLAPCMHPVYARLICASMRRRGFSEEEILRGTRLRWDDLHTNNSLLSFEQARRLFLRTIELSQCPWIGLSIGQSTQLSAHGATGYAAMAAKNVGEAMFLLQRFSETRLRMVTFEVETQSGFSITLKEVLTSPEVREYILGHTVAGLLQLLETITGQDLRASISIKWPFPEPPWSQHYRAFCRQSEFGSEQLRMDIPPALLNVASLAPDPQAYRTALRDCEHQLAQMQAGTLTTRIQRRLIDCDASSSYPTLEQMADMEHVSVRTLIRRLHEEGTTYQRLLDDVREELACWLLIHTNLSIEAIAEQLRYQDTSNFSRTFRRWLDVTPSEFRKITFHGEPEPKPSA